MTSQYTDPKTYERRVVRIAELVSKDGDLTGYTFTECQVLGPAILFLERNVEVSHCTFQVPSADAMLWEVPPSRTVVIGAVRVVDCTFSHCELRNIGFAGPRDALAPFRT